jgi:hypothetical protein
MAQSWEPGDEARAFVDLYGPWAPLTPSEVRDLMAGFGRPWWIAGGYAIEAFTGVLRAHEDIDVVVFADDVPRLREQFGGRYHLWSNHGGTFRPMDDARPEPLHPLAQVWLRKDASSPWVMDVSPSPQKDGLWQSRRHADFVAPLDAVTWLHVDGIRYVNPEVALLFKANQPGLKNDLDLANTWPLLPTDRQDWLRKALGRWNPGHPWLERLT